MFRQIRWQRKIFALTPDHLPNWPSVFDTNLLIAVSNTTTARRVRLTSAVNPVAGIFRDIIVEHLHVR